MSTPLRKIFLATLLLFSFAFSLSVLPLTTSAQTVPMDGSDGTDYSPTGVLGGRGDIDRAPGGLNNPSTQSPTTGTRAPAPTQNQATVKPSNTLTGLVISIVGFFLWITAGLFDSAVNQFVLGMGGWINGSLGNAIDMIWSLVRDLVNLTFIFGLVYVGFKTILDASANTKRLLASIIIGALLVNFSLFIAKVVIDVSNVTAIQLYNAMGIGTQSRDSSLANLSVSEVFMARMGIINLVAVPNASGDIQRKQGGWNTDGEGALAFVIGAAIFIQVAAFVFLAAAVLLTIRMAVLVILMILSPIAFAAQVFPAVETWSKKWWHSLFDQAFFAPALFFMFYITLKAAESYQGQTQQFDGIFVDAQAKNGFTTAAFFCLTMALMVAGLIIAKQMGAYGASRALNIGARSANFIRRSAQGYAGRGLVRATTKPLLSLADKNADRRWARWTIGSQTVRSALESSKSAKFGSGYSVKDKDEYKKTEKGRAVEAVRLREFNTAIKAGTSERAGAAELDAMEKAIQRATTAELEELGADILEKVGVAFSLTDSQMENVLKSDKFTAVEKEKIVASRRTGLINSSAFGGAANLAGNIKKASASQLETLGTETLFNNAGGLTASQMDDIKKSKKFTEREYTRIKDARTLALKNEFRADPAAFFSKRKASELAKMPAEILNDPLATIHLTGEVVRRVHDGDELSPMERNQLVDNINASSGYIVGGNNNLDDVIEYLKSPRGRSFSPNTRNL